jgi:response regulator RpfG family c-di-GMP phosphodiesterase
MFRPPFPTLSPELDALEMKLMLARDPSQDAMLQKALADAEARLASVDHSKVNEYVGSMQQVLMLRQRLSSTETRDQLMAQKVTLLESLLNPTPQPQA